MAILQLPYVQNKLFEQLLWHVSATTQFTIKHERFQLKWFQEVVLAGLEIQDPHQQEMLAIKQLTLQINPIQLLVNGYVTIKNIYIKGADAHLIRDKEGALNIHLFLERLGGVAKPSPTPSNKAQPFVVKQASFHAVAISIDDQQAPQVSDGFDPNHIKIEQIALELANLQARGGTLSVDIHHLAGHVANQPLVLERLCTGFGFTPNSMHLTNLVLQTGGSQLRGNIQLSYDEPASLAQFIDEVSVVAQLEELRLASDELGIFVPYFKQYHTAYALKGQLMGKVNDFYLEDFQFCFGSAPSCLKGCISLQGLPNLQALLFDVELKQGLVYMADLLPYVGEQQYSMLERVRICQAQGHFSGSPKNLLAQASLDTDLGRITSNVELAIDSSWQHASYKGAIATDKLDLGSLLGVNELQCLTMQGYIAGGGLSLATADFQLKADVHQLDFKHYAYKHIRTDGRFSQASFRGSCVVDDPNLRLQANAMVDWRRDRKELHIQGGLEKAALQALCLTDRSAHLSAQVALNLQGTSLDDFTTKAVFTQVYFDLAGRPLQLDSVYVCNDRNEAYTTLELISDLCAIRAEGALQYTALVRDIQQFVQGYQQRLVGSKPFIPNYTTQPYEFTYKVYLKDINPLLYVFMPDVYIGPNTTLTGSFSQAEVVDFALHLAKVDSLAFKGNSWENTCLDIVAQQTRDGQGLSASSWLTAEKQRWGVHSFTENLLLELAWNNDRIDFKSNLDHYDRLHQLKVEGKAVLQGEAIKVNLDHADIKVLGNLWSLHPANLITLARARIQFENLSFSSQEQQVSLAGILSPDPREELQLQLKDFALHNFTPLLNQQLAGTVNGTVVVQGTLKEPMINSEVAIQNIVIGDLLMGDLQAQTNWDNNTQQLSVACQVTHLQRPTVRITGAYRPTQAPNSLQLVADFADAQLAMLAPFVKGLFSQLGGELNGKVHVHGSLTNPWLTGGASITNGTVKIDYLNTLYRVHGTISCVKDGIRIGALNLQDDQQGKAVLQGNVQHTGLKDFRLALKANVKDFKGLDTTSEDNEYVYGTAIVSGNMTLAGPIDNIAIDIKATTKSGTRLSIPIEKKYGKQVGQESYIRFVSFQAPASDSVAQLHAAMPNRLALTLALEITPDAWAEIILDAEAGDAIKGRGKGNLTVKIDTEGSLSMSGGYEFTEGDYSFSVYKVVRKKFKILPGGSITWYDKPYEGILHVQAAYEQHATLIPLLGANSTAASAQDKRTYPVQVVLTLQGALASPELHFKVNFPELPDNPDARAAINAFQEKAADERYLTNQVFSLVVLKRFFDDNLANSSSGAVSRSVGELFSQQLSSFASQLDENLEVDADVDLTAIDRGELESLRLKLSYNFFGGRLRIAREGEISIGTDKKPDVAHLVGDWTLEYMLTRDRRLRAKLYNKYIRPAGLEDGKSSIAGGVSLMYVKSFNRWQELLGRGGKASQKKAKKSGQGK